MRPIAAAALRVLEFAQHQQCDDSHQAAERRPHDEQLLDVRPVVLAPRVVSSAVRRHRPKHHYSGEHEHRTHPRDAGQQTQQQARPQADQQEDEHPHDERDC